MDAHQNDRPIGVDRLRRRPSSVTAQAKYDAPSTNTPSNSSDVPTFEGMGLGAGPNCAICSSPPHAGCRCEAERLQIAVEQAERRSMDERIGLIREWVVNQARRRVQAAFLRLISIRQDAATAYLNSLPYYDIYMRYSGAPPLHPMYIRQLQSQITEAHAEFKRGVDLDWRASVLHYPEVLDHFYGLVEVMVPGEEHRDAAELPPTAAGYPDIVPMVGNTISNARRKQGFQPRTLMVHQPGKSVRLMPRRQTGLEETPGRFEYQTDDEGSFSSASTVVDLEMQSRMQPKPPQYPYSHAAKLRSPRRGKDFNSIPSAIAAESQKQDPIDITKGPKGLKQWIPSEKDDSTVLDAQTDSSALSRDFTELAVLDSNSNPDQRSDGSDCLCSTEEESNVLGSMTKKHLMDNAAGRLSKAWEEIWDALPDSYKWDIEYNSAHSDLKIEQGSWTCMPIQGSEPKNMPLTIAKAPVVLPVEYQWPPIGGVNPPPDPRSSTPIDCQQELTLGIVRDVFLTFEGSVGFYVLINGLLQIIVSEDFDTTWASSHLPHKFGGLKVCYIQGTLEPTMLPSRVTTAESDSSRQLQSSRLSSFRRSQRSDLSVHLNDFVEVRAGSSSREKYSGRIGLKIARQGDPRLLMSTHVITEAILGKFSFGLGISRDPTRRLRDDWNQQVVIMARNTKIGTIEKTYDQTANIYPDGFTHDITMLKPTSTAAIEEVKSPVADLGWLSREAWSSLRQRTSALKILGTTELHRNAKCIKCNLPSEASIVGEGIFFNQSAASGTKSPKDQDVSTWSRLVSRAVLYRVSPDFDPPNGYSGIALYADGKREDGTHGPGVVGFQSFVQRSGHPQSFNMPEGPAMEQRLRTGRIAFYGAFQVPEELRKEYTIM